MSLLKSGSLHNDPYCFYKLERRLFAGEFKDPFRRLRFKLNGWISARSGAFRSLGRRF